MEKSTYKQVIGADDKDDALQGTDKNDILQGLGGNDTLKGEGSVTSAAVLYAPAGAQSLFGVFDPDLLNGGAGDDTFVVNAKNPGVAVIVDYNADEDVVKLEGADAAKMKVVDTRAGAFATYEDPKYGVLYEKGVLFLGVKKDVAEKALKGELPIATLEGTDGSDSLTGKDGVRNNILGKGGNDKLTGKEKNDTLNGGDGTDYLDGGAGNDRMIGGKDKGLAAIVKSTDGKNQLFFSINADIMDVKEGRDTVVHNKGDGIDIIKGFSDDFFASDLDLNALKVVDTNRGAFAYYDNPTKYSKNIDLLRNGALFEGVSAANVTAALKNQKTEQDRIVSERDAKIATDVQKVLELANAFETGEIGSTNTNLETSIANSLATLA